MPLHVQTLNGPAACLVLNDQQHRSQSGACAADLSPSPAPASARSKHANSRRFTPHPGINQAAFRSQQVPHTTWRDAASVGTDPGTIPAASAAPLMRNPTGITLSIAGVHGPAAAQIESAVAVLPMRQASVSSCHPGYGSTVALVKAFGQGTPWSSLYGQVRLLPTT